MKKETLTGLLAAVGYSAVLGSGNWVVAVSSIFLFSSLARQFTDDPRIPVIYQVYITYTVAFSLVISGPLQLMFTRYIADRLFEKEVERVLPNYFGALSLSMFAGFVFSLISSLYIFEGVPYYYHAIFSFTVSVLSGLWVTNALLTGLKSYKHIFLSFAFSYTVTGVLLLVSVKYGLIWTFVSFYVGQCLLLFLLVFRVIRDYSSTHLFELDFLSRKRSYYSLAATGLFYNLGIWIDKFVFWFSPITGDTVFANIRASMIYDVPVILAYFSLVPGIAVFFLKIELEFATEYDNYYKAVREWGHVHDLYRLGNKMIEGVRSTLYETLRVQAIAVIFILFLEEYIFELLKISKVHIPIFNILLIGALLQLGFMVIFAVLSYFDRRMDILWLTLIFVLGNFVLTILTQVLGPYFYGYGYTSSLLIAVVAGMILLRRFLGELHYRTYMLGD
ncbi:exopolysaccharide Pel transporter PelG [Hydrogenivirga sp.]